MCHPKLNEQHEVSEQVDEVQAVLRRGGGGRLQQPLCMLCQVAQREQQGRAAHGQLARHGLVAGRQPCQRGAPGVPTQRAALVVQHQLLPLHLQHSAASTNSLTCQPMTKGS